MSSLRLPAAGYRLSVSLFVASFLSLYFEMLIVRWLASEVRLFSYFKNLTMMAAFMGLGIGFAIAGRHKDYWRWFFPLLLLYVPIALAIGHLVGQAIIVPESTEYLWRPSAVPGTFSIILFVLMVVLFFLYTLFLFVPTGQLVGRLMQGLPPLRAYMINILGSLVGIWVFAALSFVQSPPWIWFGLGLLVALWFLRDSWRLLALGAVCSAVVVLILAITLGQTLWSPYYRVDVAPLEIAGEPAAVPEEMGYMLSVNQLDHMFSVNLSPDYLESNPEYAKAMEFAKTMYDLPYEITHPNSALIVGAGMGNDTAAALRYGVQEVDAVEIDPLIYDFGKRLHPESPYGSPNVRVHIDDARAYLEKTDKMYDLIVFGILDSQTLLSGMSAVRLDNFIYTVESLEQARDHLTPNGTIALTFFVERWWIKQRLAQTLLEVFGEPPVQVSIEGTPWTMYISGRDVPADRLTTVCKDMKCVVEPPLTFEPVPLATDDWPYLYLKDRGIPTPYWVVLVVVIVVAYVSMRKAFPSAHSLDWHFFFLGGAFLLIEFKSITELALIFGSTWIVNAIAVSAVLVMVLLANLMVSNLRQINLTVLYALLFVSLLVGFVTPLEILLQYGTVVRLVGSGLLLGLPLFFASAIFSTSLKRTQDITVSFASNFFGSAVGGVLEYGSLAFGIGSLYLFGAVLYVAAWFARPRT